MEIAAIVTGVYNPYEASATAESWKQFYVKSLTFKCYKDAILQNQPSPENS